MAPNYKEVAILNSKGIVVVSQTRLQLSKGLPPYKGQAGMVPTCPYAEVQLSLLAHAHLHDKSTSPGRGCSNSGGL